MLGARFLGKRVTNQVQKGPKTCLLKTDLSTPEYLYWSTPPSCFLVIRMVVGGGVSVGVGGGVGLAGCFGI